MPQAAPCIHQFGAFHLDPQARELWRDGERLDLPRLTFEGLAFLVEHRDRAVSRDELIAAVWGRPHVEDIQVTQLIMRLRKAIGDHSGDPRFIRTVPGFGYRWIAETRTRVMADPGAVPDEDPGHSGMPSTAGLPRKWLMASLAAVLILLLSAAYLLVRTDDSSAPLARQPGQAVVVLPLDVDAPGDGDSGWVRLGAMDLIAGRLREAGLPVPPSDAVVAAMHAVAGLPAGEREAALRRALGAGVLIEGQVSAQAGGWQLNLTARGGEGDRRRVEAGAEEIVAAAGQAADRLLAALGRVSAPRSSGDNVLDEILQRGRAATLAMELDHARAILAGAPEDLRGHPVLLHQLTWVETLAGNLERAAELADRQLADARVTADPRLHAEVFMARGVVATYDRRDIIAGYEYFDAAVNLLDRENPWLPELAPALARRGNARAWRREFDAAARDLGRARTLYEIGGDRHGVARVHNSLAGLEMARRRPDEALRHFRAANEISEQLGGVNEVRANLNGMIYAQAQLLQWHDALETSERLWALRDRFQAPFMVDAIRTSRAMVLYETGQIDALRRLADHGDTLADPVRIALAWEDERWDDAVAASRALLVGWSELSGGTDDQLLACALHYQRASIRAGDAASAAALLADHPDLADHPVMLVLRAEWQVWLGEHDQAERLFRRAAATAEQWLVPATLVTVNAAYASWLLDQGRISDAAAPAGRIADWSESDFTSAALQLWMFHAGGQEEAWRAALERARRLAGERRIPEALLTPPVAED